MTKILERDLERLKKDLLIMGGLVEEAANKAIAALIRRETALAQEVLAGDDAIDQREVELENVCLKVLALHQPVAVDLRFIIVVLKVNNDLERIGDLARNIAERAVFLSAHEPIPAELEFDRMLERVREMLALSLDALVHQDPARARRVCALDDDVDAYNRRMYEVLQDLMRRDPDTIERAVQTLSVARHLERIGDLATNIAEDVVFMVEGDVIRHQLEDASE